MANIDLAQCSGAVDVHDMVLMAKKGPPRMLMTAEQTPFLSGP